MQDDNFESSIVVDEPSTVLELLSRIVRERKRCRRVIFFCHCEYPCGCHRHKVANLLLAAAKTNGVRLNVSEWPGGVPRTKRLPRFELSRKQARSDNAQYLLLSEDMSRARFKRALSLPWMSIARVRHGNWQRTIITGPAKFTHRGWALPYFDRLRGKPDAKLKRSAADARRKWITHGYSVGNERTPIRLRSTR